VPTFTHIVHVGLTVNDRNVSAEWYERVLGFRFVKEFDTGIPRTLLLHPDSGFLVGLYTHPDASGDPFSPRRTGLDHLALAVADEDQLIAWSAVLDRLGVDHSPVRDLGHARFVSLEDPDGIQIELWLTVIPHRLARDERGSE
jgi:catechol 2,3-dioxygenase-like lactoylglutathione lyase family enzyme